MGLHGKAGSVDPAHRRGMGRGRAALVALAVTGLTFLALVPLSQAKVVVNGFGTFGTLGGQFGSPSGIDVNQTGNGGVPAGTIYVVDSQSRVQRFSSTGVFERAWGQDVVTGGVTTFEICTVAAECKEGSTSGATENGGQLSGPWGVAVNQASGHVYVTEYINHRVSEFDADGAFVRTWGWDVISSGKPNDKGTSAFEICDTTAGNAAADCKRAASEGGDGGRLGFGTGYPVVDSTGNVWVPDGTSRRIQEFDSTGNFIAAYGYDVDALGGGGGVEKCTSAVAGACKAAPFGSSVGQFGFFSPEYLALDSPGNVYALDSSNARVQKFDPTVPSATVFNKLIYAPYTSNAPERLVAAEGGERLIFAVNNNVSASESQIIEVDLGDEEVKDASLVGSKLSGIGGLAEDHATGVLYATTPSGASPRRILVLGDTPLPDPGKALDPITTKADTTATFSGSVDPMGGLVNCTFQYSTDQDQWTDLTEPDCQSLAPGGGAQAISQNVSGLDPNQQYFVRLAVSRPLVAGSTKTTGVQSFTTDAVPPVVSGVGAIQVADTSVRLVGSVNPRHSDTEYVFLYGTTPALGSSTPVAHIGDSVTPLVVSRVVEGLTPDTEYFFKLVATNSVAQVESGTEMVTTRATPLPNPDNRAYEQVSPPFKNYADADNGGAKLGLSGEGASFRAFGSFGDPPGQVVFFDTEYVSRRTETGWQSGSANPTICPYDSNSQVPYGYAFPFESVDLDENIEHGVAIVSELDSCGVKPLSPEAPVPGTNLYKLDFATDPFKLTGFQLLAPKRNYDFGGPKTYTAGTAFFLGGSPDFSHVVYTSGGRQTPDTPPQGPNYIPRLFHWHEGDLSLISVEPGTNATFPGETDLAGRPDAGSISDDGNRIFMGYPGIFTFSPTRELYMRENDTTTYMISQSECTSSCGSVAKAEFTVATPDGSKALFASQDKRTDDDTQEGKDLYLYTHGPNPQAESNLRLIDKDNEPADGTDGTLAGVFGISDDATTVFFVASGQLVAGEPTAPGPKLYRWLWNAGSPTIDYLATLGSQESGRWGTGFFGAPFGSNNQVTPSGGDIVLGTDVALDPIADRDSSVDVYRWDAEEEWSCVSCQFPGDPSVGPSNTASFLDVLQISDDGKRIPFTSDDALLPADTNGEDGCSFEGLNGAPSCRDVYEWHDGALRLISTGIGTTYSRLYGMSRSGRDILFSTADRLVGWDTDTNRDIYDARIDGGFPEPAPEPAPCEGEACRGPGTSVPPGGGAGTGVFEGPGNSREVSCPKTTRKVTVKGRKICQKKRRRSSKRHNRRHPKRAGGGWRAGK